MQSLLARLTLTLGLLYLASLPALAQSPLDSAFAPIRLGTPAVLSAENEALAIEIPILQGLNASSRVRLALPAAHNQRDTAYPTWLSDAVLSIKNRRQQRRVLFIQAQRGNPELVTEMVLEFETDGKSTFKPYTLMLDRINSFGKDTSPDPIAAIAQSTWSKAPTSTLETQSVGNKISFASPEVPPVAVAPPKKPAVQAKKANGARADTPSLMPPPPIPASEIPNSAATAPTNPATTTATTPPSGASPQSPSPARPPVKAAWYADWETWAMGAGLVLILLLLFYVMSRIRQARKATFVRRAPTLTTKQAQFQETQLGSQANTVFGLSDQEANEMHQQWLKNQIKK